ncbi:MAG: aspartate dehydrogenase [Rhizobiales bacterium]|nr:aspartate dehydrogenase [Hyphomicrobiales bacterium]
MAKKLNVAIIGFGAIGTYVAKNLIDDQAINLVGFLCREGREEIAAQIVPGIEAVSKLSDFSIAPDLVADCGGHAALRAHGPAILRGGTDLVTISIGALANAGLATELENAARSGNAQLRLASGSIGALDILSAAMTGGLEEIIYRGRKPPSGWKGSPAEQALELDSLTQAAIHFKGSARKAALQYPKNANVAAAVALAGPGLDETKVELIADPAITRNIHEIEASGAFGKMQFRVEANPFPDNPKSSMLAAMSMVSTIRKMCAPVA